MALITMGEASLPSIMWCPLFACRSVQSTRRCCPAQRWFTSHEGVHLLWGHDPNPTTWKHRRRDGGRATCPSQRRTGHFRVRLVGSRRPSSDPEGGEAVLRGLVRSERLSCERGARPPESPL